MGVCGIGCIALHQLLRMPPEVLLRETEEVLETDKRGGRRDTYLVDLRVDSVDC